MVYMHCNFSLNLFPYNRTTDNNYKKEANCLQKVWLNTEFKKDYGIFAEGLAWSSEACKLP